MLMFIQRNVNERSNERRGGYTGAILPPHGTGAILPPNGAGVPSISITAKQAQ